MSCPRKPRRSRATSALSGAAIDRSAILSSFRGLHLAIPFDVTRDVATHVVGWSCPRPPSNDQLHRGQPGLCVLMQVKNVAAAIIDAGANTAVRFFGDRPGEPDPGSGEPLMNDLDIADGQA